MKTKHTPAPWDVRIGSMTLENVQTGKAFEVPSYEIVSPMAPIAKIHHSSVANATLIAAAPEMLETLDMLLPILLVHLDPKKPAYSALIQIVSNTITKAKGGAE